MKTIDPVEDALLFLESASSGRRMERWSDRELRELKRESERFPFVVDLHRAIVAERNNWTHRGGRADAAQVEAWMNEFYET